MKRIHMMGINGSGMKGVASLATKMGYDISGCDLNDGGHSVNHLKNVDLLVVSPAVLYQSKSDPEFLQGLKRKIVMTWEEFVGKYLMKNKYVIAIAGTHGKSTTTAMLAKILIDAKLDPSVVIGAYVPEWNGNSRFGKSKYFIIEADEFNDNFLNYSPDIAAINNIEFDHPDYFKNEKDLLKSFEKFIKNVKEGGDLIEGFHPARLGLLQASKTVRCHLAVADFGKKFNLKVWGEHNQQNANMAYLVAKKLGIRDEEIVKSLENFTGIGRRMELIAKLGKTLVYDDYAHHPTAIKTTLAGLRSKYKDKKILAIVEPHGYKRTKALLPLYRNCFNAVDSVIIGPIFKARDKVDKAITPEKISRVSRHPDIKAVKNLNELLDTCNLILDTYNIVVVMGAGNSSNWAHEILRTKKKPSFKDLTTLKVGGRIKYFKEVSSEDELVSVVKVAKQKKLPVFVIGEGSDIAASDSHFDGVVIRYLSQKIRLKALKNSRVLISAQAGVKWDDLVKLAVDNKLQGIEKLSAIPGTVGASPIQNIGAYGQDLSQTFFNLKAYDLDKEKFVYLNKKDCQFSYRNSIFKSRKFWQKYIITEVTLKLKKDLKTDLAKIREEIIATRREKLENPKLVPNAGSFFVNPFVNKKEKERLQKILPDIKFYEEEKLFKISAGFLIEKAGWKGKSLGPVKVSDKHALILTNPKGKGNFSDLKNLADAIIADVYKKFKIKLEPEVQYINL